MTREEAIECNKNLRMYMKLSDKYQPCKFLEENYIALDMAIEALKQERSRLAQITQYRNDCEKLMQENEQLKKALKQEPKTGRWIAHREHCEMNNLIPSGLGSYFWCSECDCGIDVREWSRNHYNYCPNCGAKM